MNNINIYNYGIQGYTLKGVCGADGESGHNIFYSVYVDESVIENKVKNNFVLSNSYNNTIEYKENDTIISANGKMYTISTDKNISYIGDIINQSKPDDDFKDFNDIVIPDIDIETNVYINNDDKLEINANHFPRYNELTEDKIKGIYLKLPLFDRVQNIKYKLLIMHLCGLVQEIDISDYKDYKIFIEQKYFDLIPNNDTYNTNDYKNYILSRSCIDVYNTSNDCMYRYQFQ